MMYRFILVVVVVSYRMGKLIQMNVLVVGLRGLGVEIGEFFSRKLEK
jgi:hypothetical protein